MISFRLAKETDIDICLRFIDDAREHQREQGFIQWTDKSPCIDNIIEDISNRCGYLITDNDIPFGYVCISFSGETAYDSLEGNWLSDCPYAIIHRLAFGKIGRGKGASKEVFIFASKLCHANGVYSLRIDTHENNRKMRHIIEREGFTYCGTVYYNGSPRMAYEKMI